jgi:hypothetical protein
MDASDPHLGLKPQAIRENPLKRVQELISRYTASHLFPYSLLPNP